MGKFNFIITIVLLALFWEGCKQGKNEKISHIQELYFNRNNLIRDFENKSIFVRGNILILKLYTKTKENNFYFEISEASFDGIQKKFHLTHYELNDPMAMIATEGFSVEIISDKFQFAEVIETLIRKYTDTMTRYSIREVTSEFSRQGVDLKFYLEGNTSVFYVKNNPLVLNGSWKEYVTKAYKIDGHWYYYLDEQSEY